MAKKNLDDMTVDELKAELKSVKANLDDYEEMHAFTFTKTSVHISATKVDEMQTEYDDEVTSYKRRIAEIEKWLKEKGYPS